MSNMVNNISVLILTLNEEENLPTCLASLTWCDDIVILDSYSTDRTEKVAKVENIRFFRRRFDDYAKQRNYGLDQIDYKHSWLLMLDADEVVPDELTVEMTHAIRSCEENVSLFRMRRKDYFMGRWVKRSSGYPTWFGRLMRVGKVHVARDINEEFIADGVVSELQGHFIHYPFNKGFHAWFEKHNRYSSMEAAFMMKGGLSTPKLSDLFAKDPVVRRKMLKAIVYRLPGRPFIMFIALYVFRGGFLDGRAGLIFSSLRAFYEFMINCKVIELKRKNDGRKL